MEIQDLTDPGAETFFPFLHLTDKSKLLLFYDYSNDIDYKQRLQEVLMIPEDQILNFHEIYARIKAFSFKKMDINYGTAFLLLLSQLFNEQTLAKLDISYLWSNFTPCVNLFVICIRKCLFEGNRLSTVLQKITKSLIVPLHELCFGPPCEACLLNLDGLLNALISDPQKKFENMEFAVHKGPKAIFFLRVFFNVPLKLISYAIFRLSTKCWMDLLNVCSQITSFFSKNRDHFPEVAVQFLNDIVKFLSMCFQTYSSVDKDKDPYQREILLNEISLYILSNPGPVAEYFYSSSDNLICNYVHLCMFLVRNDRIKEFDQIDKIRITSTLMRMLQEILKSGSTLLTPNGKLTYIEEKEKICVLVELISILSPASLGGFLTEKNVKQLMLCTAILRELGANGLPVIASSVEQQEKSSILQSLLEPFKQDMELSNLQSLLNYSNQMVNQTERPTIFSFLEKVQFNFSPKEVETNKELVQEILRDLNLKEDKCDPYYAKFCCFFILKVPSYAIPEGFCFNILLQNIFKALSSHWNLLHDLLVNLPHALYRIAFRGSLTHLTHITDILQQIGNIAYRHIEEFGKIMSNIKEEKKDPKKLYKAIGEFLELHYLMAWTLLFPLKISQGFFKKKTKQKGESKERHEDEENIVIMRKFCTNCGFRRQNSTCLQDSLDFCKHCGMYLEPYIFKNYPEKMLRSESVNAKLREILEMIKRRAEKVAGQMENALKAQYGGTQNIWFFVANYDFIVWNVMENLLEFYDMA